MKKIDIINYIFKAAVRINALHPTFIHEDLKLEVKGGNIYYRFEDNITWTSINIYTKKQRVFFIFMHNELAYSHLEWNGKKLVEKNKYTLQELNLAKKITDEVNNFLDSDSELDFPEIK